MTGFIEMKHVMSNTSFSSIIFFVFSSRQFSKKIMNTLEEKIQRLSPELQQEVEQFVQSLLEKTQKREKKIPKFEWAGALKELRDQYTSVELQHEILNERMKQP